MPETLTPEQIAYREWIRDALFRDVSDAALSALVEAAERRVIAGGDVLVRQGQPANCLFFVRTGRFRVLIAGPEGGERMVAQIEAGEPVGELAFFGGGVRTATLQASRDSVVLALDRSAYDRVVAAHPEIMSAILTTVSQRLARVTGLTPRMEAPAPKVIALLAAGNSQIPPGFVERLARAMEAVLGDGQPVLHIGAADAPTRDREAYQGWLHGQEIQGGYVLVDARNGQDAAWSDLACRNADALVMVGGIGDDPAPSVDEAMALRWIWPQNRTLVLLRHASDSPIAGTAAWLAPRQPHLHHHMVADSAADIARLARFLTGNAVGLVLAGGGALGCAHLGIVRGLLAAGIPIDTIGGTSAGAAMGAAIAMGLTVDQTLDQVEAMFIKARAMRRLTLPVHSLLDPRVFDAELQARYSARDIVDQPTGFFAISTNLSTNNLHVHRSGPLWEAVRASGSLPTILPPFIDDDGNILVDGGVLDNVPVVTMRQVKAGPNIVVTLGDATQQWRIKSAYKALRGPGRLLADFVLRRKAKGDFPSIIDVMSRSMVVASRIASRSMLAPADVLLTPPIIEGMQILDWHLGRRQAVIAADYVARQLADNPALAALVTAR